MFYLAGDEKEKALEYLAAAADVAQDATCERARCGSVIVKDDEVIGKGYNSPPGNLESQRRCHLPKDAYHQKVTDKTCCVHAEQRAVMDALAHNPDRIEGSTLYFMRIDEEGEMTEAGDPYCTICSKMVLDAGVERFVLRHRDGIGSYLTSEYNERSFSFGTASD